jgi:hypothetical protein
LIARKRRSLKSTVVARPPVKSGDNNTPSTPPAAATAVAFHDTQTDSFVALLQQLGASLLSLGLRFPKVIGFQQETIQHTLIVLT